MASNPSYAAAIEAGILALSDACDGARTRDGQGFDGGDTEFGKSLARQIRASRWPTGQRLSPRQFPVAQRMVTGKYRNQLRKLGVIIPDPEPVLPKGTPLSAIKAPERPAQAPYQPAYAVAPDGARTLRPHPTLTPVQALPRGQGTESSIAQAIQQVPRTFTLPVGPPTDAFDMLDRMMLVIAAKLPGFEVRPQQRLAMECVIRALTGEGDFPDFTGEIGTGGGKSLTLLLSHLAATYETRQPAIIATATKALQMQYRKDVVRLQEWLADVRPFTAAEIKGRRNYLCLKPLNDKQEELRQTGEVSFRTTEAGVQFVEQIIPWEAETERGDIEDAPFEWLPAAKSELTTGRDGCAGKDCAFAAECYANRAVQAAAHADIVIGNTHLVGEHIRIYAETDQHAGVIPLGIKPRGDGEEDDEPEPDVDETAKPILYWDEAHAVEEIMRSVLGKEVTRGRVSYLVERLQHFTTGHKAVKAAIRDQDQQRLSAEDQAEAEGIVRSAQVWAERITTLTQAANRAFDSWQQRMVRDKKSSMRLGDETDVAQPLLDALDALRLAVKDQTPRWLGPGDEPLWRKLHKQVVELLGDLTAVVTPGDADRIIRYMELDRDEETGRQFVTLFSALISVAERLREILWSAFPHVVSVSATLAGPDGLDHWRRRVGAPDTEELVVPAPFNYPQQSLLYLPANARLLDPRRDARNVDTVRGREYLTAFIFQCEQLVRASEGGALLLFTSRKDLQNAYLGAPAKTIGGRTEEEDVDLPAVIGLADRLGGDYPLYRQGQLPKPELVRLIKEQGNAVLLGVKSFWEGVDIAGEALRLVIINAFPFVPPDDPVWEALCEAVDRQAGEDQAWFRQLAVPNATIALKQGFGRLIRTQTDFGVVAILDGRCSLTQYGRQIMDALPPATRTRTLEDVRRFYQMHRGH